MRIRWLKLIRILALSFILLVLALWAGIWLWYRPSHTDRVALESRYTLWHNALSEKRFSEAYAVMSPAYRESHSEADFTQHFEFSGDSLNRLEKGYSLRVHGLRARLYPRASGFLEMWGGLDFYWIKTESGWYLTGEYLIYAD